MNLSDDQIKEIADYLDSGMICMVHKKTGKIIPLPDEDHWSGDLDEWEEDITETENNPDDYLEFEGMSSSDSFHVMEAFTDSVDDDELRSRLSEALRKRKPFRNFKDVINFTGDYRQKWFEYKNTRLIKWVRKQLETHQSD